MFEAHENMKKQPCRRSASNFCSRILPTRQSVTIFWIRSPSIDASLAGGTGSAIGFDTGNPLRGSIITDAGFALHVGDRW
jgi:hypothetical protein